MTSEAAAVRVARLVPRTVAEGPGVRSALWVQGCSVRCPGCFNPHTWAASGGRLAPVSDLVRALTSRPEVEGVTLLGGEPFDQAEPLAVLAAQVQAAGLTVMAFTGFLLEDLQGGTAPAGARALLDHVDLLVDGPFLRALPERHRPWVGSSNQRFHALTGAYVDLLPRLSQLPDRLEVTLQRDGSVLVNGYADVEKIEVLLDGFGRRPRRSH